MYGNLVNKNNTETFLTMEFIHLLELWLKVRFIYLFYFFYCFCLELNVLWVLFLFVWFCCSLERRWIGNYQKGGESRLWGYNVCILVVRKLKFATKKEINPLKHLLVSITYRKTGVTFIFGTLIMLTWHQMKRNWFWVVRLACMEFVTTSKQPQISLILQLTWFYISLTCN